LEKSLCGFSQTIMLKAKRASASINKAMSENLKGLRARQRIPSHH
jgi:hypothetical protein